MTNLEKYRSLLHDGVQGLLLTSRYSRMYAAEYDIAEFLSGKVDIVDADVLKDDRFGKNVQRDMVLL